LKTILQPHENNGFRSASLRHGSGSTRKMT
jgi:hypothetical protein